MKRLALTLAALAGAVGIARWLCARRGHPDARRTPHGGFRCPLPCGKAHATLPTLKEEGHVNPLRKTFDRDPLAVIRSAGW